MYVERSINLSVKILLTIEPIKFSILGSFQTGYFLNSNFWLGLSFFTLISVIDARSEIANVNIYLMKYLFVKD